MMRCPNCSLLEYNLMCRCCDNWRVFFWPMPMEVAVCHGNHYVLSSCFAPWHMATCRSLHYLLDKASKVNVIDNVLDAIEWERTITEVFKQLDTIDEDPRWAKREMTMWVHHRMRTQFGRVLELAVQFLYAPVNYVLRSHRGIQYRKAMREFMSEQ